MEEDELLVTFDVKLLYTSVPVKLALNCVRKLLSSSSAWQGQWPLSVKTVMEFLTTCLSESAFKFREQFYNVKDGLAMGSPVSAIVANIFMADLEERALSTMRRHPKLWFRYVDDVLSIVKRREVETTLAHLNQQDEAIVFTMEEEKDGFLPSSTQQ